LSPPKTPGICCKFNKKLFEIYGSQNTASGRKKLYKIPIYLMNLKNNICAGSIATFRYHGEKEGTAGNISAPKVGHKWTTEM
jgi:hypothetical protein